jgi:DUF218 domain.
MDLERIKQNINILGEFLGKRDIEALQPDELKQKYHISQADVLILFGGSIPYGCDVVGKAISEHFMKQLMIVGGEGHTTQTLRKVMQQTHPGMITEGKMEADMMYEYIHMKYPAIPVLLERKSTNCGNNITNALELLRQNKLKQKNIVIVQDSTMQLRMDAGFRKYLQDTDIKIINFAAYQVRAEIKDEKLTFEPSNLWGMWDMERYISLLLGEIPRLTDDQNGYGPNGKGYIAHVDIPEMVRSAFEELSGNYADLVRTANPRYASVIIE